MDQMLTSAFPSVEYALYSGLCLKALGIDSA